MNLRFSIRHLRWLALATVLIVACAVAVINQRAMNPPAGGGAGMPLDPTAILVTFAKPSGAPCQVIVSGGSKDMRHRMSAHLGDGAAQSAPIQFPGPTYTIESVSVSRNGSSMPQEMNVTLHAGNGYEVRISENDEIAVVPTPK